MNEWVELDAHTSQRGSLLIARRAGRWWFVLDGLAISSVPDVWTVSQAQALAEERQAQVERARASGRVVVDCHEDYLEACQGGR